MTGRGWQLAGWIWGWLLVVLFCAPLVAQQTESILIDAQAPATPLPHFWEQMFGSGHANLALREDYRNDLVAVKSVTEMKYVRFHGILDDENGVYTEDEHRQPQYNFTYVDEIYDGLLARGVRPVVEIGFMPKALASDPEPHVFWYRPNVSPPKDYARWGALIRALGQHLVERYGVEEVAQWYFEVWNEPNIVFWAGNPKQATYFELYSHTARALKAANPRLRVGGPASSAMEWVPEFLRTMHDTGVPVDFVSTHGYQDENFEHTFSPAELPPMDDRLCAIMGKVKQQIAASPMPNTPWFVTEWNVIGIDAARDTTYVGPAVANVIRECDGLANMMSFWTFDDVFEEDGPKREPFDGGFGLIAPHSIRKPSFNAFAMLHRLGSERLANQAKDALVTRRADGTLVVAVWNLVDPPGAKQAGFPGAPKRMLLTFQHVSGLATGTAAASITRLDPTHGNTLAAYRAMGSPRYPTQVQIRALNAASELGPPETATLKEGKIEVDLPVNSLVMLEVAQ
ncbi:MAG: xylan 1,4-beta-xylosidase [Acidobacteriaceae bacterium]|nr:xylan 1,4-beta-xylosidase [Acidobacteriaceae bacterium]